MSARRGLRTRVYDANMSMVENNYRAALERLERSRRATSLEREAKPRGSPFTGGASAALANRYDFNGSIVDEELQAARSRASKVIQEKSIIDQRAEQFRSTSLAPAPLNSVLLENEFDDQVRMRRFLLRRSWVNHNNSVIYVVPLPSDASYFPRCYYDYYSSCC
ncbi:hypothetical protein AND_008934 [Anopheles darlingi]|uniref:Uncharacterized protein n=1 Tax=Anopheles darlingi TaxID=43151 RepID=W5J7X5_ANODA|nr:hypothetical protein AND_008934 [Anopheles darlingi]